MSTSFSVCVDSSLNPVYDEPNEFDYIDYTEDFVDTTSIKYRAQQFEPIISKAIFSQQEKAAAELTKIERTIVILDQGTKEMAKENIQGAKSASPSDKVSGPNTFLGALCAGFMIFMIVLFVTVLLIGLAL